MFNLPKPDNSIAFFESLKQESEKYWSFKSLDHSIYGFQVQPFSKWKPGLDEQQLIEFEKTIGFEFPGDLKNFYRTMNGLDLPGINIHGGQPISNSFEYLFYSYPDQLSAIKSVVEWIYHENGIKEKELRPQGASRIFPIYGHRFMLIDHDAHPVLSMYGNDTLYWSENISKLLAKEIFGSKLLNEKEFETDYTNPPYIKFWVDKLP